MSKPCRPFGTEILFRPRNSGSLTTATLDQLIAGLRSRLSVAYPEVTEPLIPAVSKDRKALHATIMGKRVLIHCATVPMAVAMINFLGLKLLAPYNKPSMVAFTALWLIGVYVLRLTREELGPTAAPLVRRALLGSAYGGDPLDPLRTRRGAWRASQRAPAGD